jgi:hypothetical protein
MWLKHDGGYKDLNLIKNKELFKEDYLHSCFSKKVLYCANDRDVYMIKLKD